MKLIELSIIDFINQVDSDAPAPGGGSVAALLSTLGISLARMVGHLSVEKKRFKNLAQDIQDQFNSHMKHLETIKHEIIPLIDKDTQAFNDIMLAYQISKDEKEKKEKAIEKATLGAIEVPYRVATISYKALETISFILAYGNKQTISDIGVAALSIASGIEGAAMNVLINLPGLSDKEQKDIYQNEMKILIQETQTLKQDILNLVYEGLTI